MGLRLRPDRRLLRFEGRPGGLSRTESFLRRRAFRPVSLRPAEDEPIDIGPKLGEGIFSHQAQEPQARAHGGGPIIGLAVRAPGIREKVVSRHGYVTRVRGRDLATAIVRQEAHPHHIPDSSREVLVVGPEITWIFPPNDTQPRFHGIAGRDSGQSHSVTLSEASPVSTVFPGGVPGGSDARAEQPDGKGFRADGALCEPLETLAGSDGMVGFDRGGRRIRRRRRLIGGDWDVLRRCRETDGEQSEHCEDAKAVHKLWIAGATERLPVRKPMLRWWCHRRDSNPHTLAGTWT
jgi:hypothetical protein